MINKISTIIDRINRILLIFVLILVGIISAVYVIKSAPQWAKIISKQIKETSLNNTSCPAKSGYVTCGYCSEDKLLSNNPHAGQCIYCPQGTTCKGDVCDEGLICSGGCNTDNGKNTEPTSNYYVLCWDCQAVRNVSYNGRDTATCNFYWSLCDVYQCRNKRRKCW